MTTQRAGTAKPEIPQFSVFSILRAFWKHRLLALVTALVLAAGTAGVVHKLPAMYRSEALILVDSQKIPEKYVSSTVNTDVGDRLQTISQQILSSTRLQKIIDDFGLYRDEKKNHVQEEIIELMRKDIDIKLEKGWTGGRPGAFRVAYRGPNPNTVAEVANRISNLFIEENLRTREVQADGTSEFIDAQMQDAKKRLDETEAAVSKFKLEHNGELPEQENSLMGTLARLQVELQGNQDALNRDQQNKVIAENALAMAESAEASMKKAVAMGTPAGSAGPPRQPPMKTSESLELQLDALRTRYGSAHPDVKRLQNDIAWVKRLESEQEAKSKTPQSAPSDAGKAGAEKPQKAAEPEKAEPSQPATQAAAEADPRGLDTSKTGKTPGENAKRSQAEEVVPPELAKARQQIGMIQVQLQLIAKEIETKTAERQHILQEIASYDSRINKLPLREQEMAQIVRDYEISKANYRTLLEKKNAAEMASDMERREKAERFEMLDPARVPEKPVSPDRPLLDWLGGAAGIILGLAVAFGKELKSNVLLGEWELPATYTVLGRVPRIEMLHGAANTGGPSDESSERSRKRKKLRVVLVSSAVLSLLAVTVAGIYFAIQRL